MKRSLLLALAALSGIGLYAAPISPQQALQRLGGLTRGGSAQALRLAYTTHQSDGDAAVYVFNNTAASGYLFLSADDCAAPLLGYSEKGTFKENEMSPEMLWWLGEYGRQIEYARQKGINQYVTPATRASQKAVAPLVATEWNQDAPYNGMTPVVDGKHCVTGCVATSTAQVMKRWNYPEIGKGTATCTVIDNSGNDSEESMDFSERKFDWANMLDVYTTSATAAQNDAVAYLMKACGYGARMTYTSVESGSSGLYAGEALIKNFGYNKNIQYCSRSFYDPYQWEDMVYGELAAGRPIIYGGQSTQGGHSFVCDGYDGNGFYHFNWGWGGMSDGYFALNALDPGSLGIGANGGGYNFYQDIVRGVQPSTSEYLGSSLEIEGIIEGKFSGNKMTVTVPGLWNDDAKDLNFALGICIEPLAPTSGSSTYKTIDANMSIPVLRGYTNFSFDTSLSTTLSDGTYKITLSMKPLGEKEWYPILADQLGYNYLIVTKSGNRFTVQKNKEMNIKVEDAEVVGDLVYGQVATFSVTVSNPTDRDVTKSVYPVLCDGGVPVMIAQGVTLDIDAGEKLTKEFSCVFSLIKGASVPTTTKTYRLRFYDPSIYSYGEDPTNLTFYSGFTKSVDLKIEEKANLVVTEFSMPGLVKEDGFYQVENLASVPFSVTLNNKGGYFGNVISYVVYINPPGTNDLDYVNDYSSEVVQISNGETKTLNTTLNLTGYGEGQYYVYLYANGYLKQNGKDARTYFEIKGAGVEAVEADSSFSVTFDRNSGVVKIDGASEITSVDVYSLTGKRCDGNVKKAGSKATADLNALPAGVYVVKATSADGKSRTLKIVK